MRLINRVSAILKNKSGASLMFVLGIMLFLLAIAGSVLAAASANIGANARQERHNRAELLTESIHRNIKYSLEMTPLTMDYTDTDFENSLAYQIAQVVYNNASAETPIDMIYLDIDIPKVETDMVDSILLEILFQDVRYTGPIEAVLETDPPTPRVPMMASVNAKMSVKVVVEVESASLREAPRFITTMATYEYRDGILSDTNAMDEIGEMEFRDFGKWVLLSYEIIESESAEK